MGSQLRPQSNYRQGNLERVHAMSESLLERAYIVFFRLAMAGHFSMQPRTKYSIPHGTS